MELTTDKLTKAVGVTVGNQTVTKFRMCKIVGIVSEVVKK